MRVFRRLCDDLDFFLRFASLKHALPSFFALLLPLRPFLAILRDLLVIFRLTRNISHDILRDLLAIPLFLPLFFRSRFKFAG